MQAALIHTIQSRRAMFQAACNTIGLDTHKVTLPSMLYRVKTHDH